jgi:alkaline phosphatase D
VGADVLLLLGDNHYADTTDRAGQVAAYLEHRAVPGFADVAARVPVYGIWDDHDFGPDNSDGTEPGKADVLAVFKDFWANPAYGRPGRRGGEGIYFRFRRGGIDFFMLDVRYHRSPNGAADVGGNKTMLGPVQLAWLKAGLKASTAAVKVLASGSEWQPHGHADTWMSFPRERDEVLDFVADEDIAGVLLLSGDRHFTAGYQLERGGLLEVTCGPLGSRNEPGPTVPRTFLYAGEGKLFCVLDVETAPSGRGGDPRVSLEVWRAGTGVVERRRFAWPQILGQEELEYLPVGGRGPTPTPGSGVHE